jgi:hypothetical protein
VLGGYATYQPPHENACLRELDPLQTARHRLAPSCMTVEHRGRAHRQLPPMKTCDKTGYRMAPQVPARKQSARLGRVNTLPLAAVYIVHVVRYQAKRINGVPYWG